MDKEFVPYEQARTLKELGFDDSCLSYSYGNGVEFHNHRNVKNSEFPHDANELVTLPLYQQAFRWFREKYSLQHEITRQGDRWWLLSIIEIDKVTENGVFNGKQYWLEDYNDKEPSSYEDAELACLKRLIEIVKIDE